MVEEIKSFKIEKYHRFGSAVKLISKFDNVTDETDLYLVDNQHLYNLKTHKLVYTFHKNYVTKMGVNAYSGYIINYSKLIEYYQDDNIKLENHLRRLVFKISEWDGQYFKMAESKTYDVSIYTHCGIVNKQIIFFNTGSISVNTQYTNFGSHHYYESNNPLSSDIFVVNLSDLESPIKILGRSIISGQQLINNRFGIIFRISHYVIYDFVLHKELLLLENGYKMEYVASKNEIFVSCSLDYIDNLFVYKEKECTTLYKLTDTETTIIQDNECVVCFRDTSKLKILIPCGHTKYCEVCVDKMKNTKCYICGKQVESIIQIYN